MNNKNKYFIIFYPVLFVFLLIFALNTSAQTTNNGQADDHTIVHNDQTGIVMEVIAKNKNQNILKIQDKETGRISHSTPTHMQASSGDKVIYRPMCHCTCTIKSVLKD